MILETTQHDETPLSILGVYAPNAPGENSDFWPAIQQWFESHPRTRKPDVLGGDTNFVEDTLDRLPAHEDPDSAVSAFDSLKEYLSLTDGWRDTYPTIKAHTYHQVHTGSQSRIDRIYIKRGLMEHAYEWEIESVGIKTDHRMVTVKLTTEKAPTLGHGRWVCPLYIIQHRAFKKFVHENGLVLVKRLEAVAVWEIRDEGQNTQTIWKRWKDQVYDEARRLAKIVIPKMNKEIFEMEAKLKIILEDTALSEEEIKLSGGVLTEKLAALHVSDEGEDRLRVVLRRDKVAEGEAGGA
jgi:hypothetical protein